MYQKPTNPNYTTDLNTYLVELKERYNKSSAAYEQHTKLSADFRHYVYFLVNDLKITPTEVARSLQISRQRVGKIIDQVEYQIKKGGDSA